MNEPQNDEFRIWDYVKGHSQMSVRVYRPVSDETLYWAFEGVEYFEGLMSWQGTGFTLESASQCVELLRKIRRFEGIPDSYLAEAFKLFTASVVANNFSKVRILALNGNVYKEDPFAQYR